MFGATVPSNRVVSKVTIKDVARTAGVAWSTASYALNGGPKPVSETVRQRVFAAAHDLGYSSNLMAKGLVTGRTRTLGILVPEFSSYNATEQVAGIEAEAQEHDYRVVLAAHMAQPLRAETAQRDMSARRLEGIVSVSATADVKPNVLAALPGLRIPLVLTYHAPIDGFADADYGVVHQEQGGCIATHHLLQQGRRRLAFVGPFRQKDAAQKRFVGFCRTHVEAGIAWSDECVVETEQYSARDGIKAGQTLWEQRTARPDAIFAASDSLAAGLMRTAHRLGLRVPDDVAIIGFDDMSTLCVGLDPSLTSVHVPLFEIGRWSARRLIERLSHPDDWQASIRYFECTLTVRESA